MGANDKLEATFHPADEWTGPVSKNFDELGADAPESNSDEALQQAANQEMEATHRRLIEFGIKSLVTISGRNSAAHGFHEDWPVDVDLIEPGKDRDYQKAITEKLMLMGEELFESFGEIRSGRDPLEIYFVDAKGLIGAKGHEYSNQAYADQAEDGTVGAFVFGTPRPGWKPILKPEGFIVEIADLLIRAADLAYLLNGRGHLVSALAIKHEYNATRPFKHGRQF